MMLYEVGGSVRDALMGRPSNDTDMVAVVESWDWEAHSMNPESDHPLDLLVADLKTRGFSVIPARVDRRFMTIKAIAPSAGFTFAGRPVRGAVDFVLARRDGSSRDGRHPDRVGPGSLSDDLRRRDFTVNAVARGPTGELIDEHGGVQDIGNQVLRCVGDPLARLEEDRLRVLRALRFHVTHDMCFAPTLMHAIRRLVWTHGSGLLTGVSEERVREELLRMFREDSAAAVNVIRNFDLQEVLFRGRLWLKPTLEDR